MRTIGYNDPMMFFDDIVYRVIRSKRRSISLEVDKRGKLIVRMPLRLPEKIGLEFVREKSLWIKKKMAIVAKRVSSAKTFTVGEEFLFLGSKYPLSFVSDKKTKLVLMEGFFVTSENRKEKLVKIFKDFYKNAARDITGKMVREYGRKFSLQYKDIKITSAKTRWGSCSSRGDISFSWRLIMSPPGVVEYVVVHEMAHLKHGNHSRKFWSEVKKMLPDYEKRKKWLKDNGYSLTLD
jgi:predicted metal-dependent hydrolase